MKVRFKKLSDSAVLPSYSKPGDAGLDLTATTRTYNKNGDYIEYGTDLAVEIPDGYVGLVFPRSSTTTKNIILGNSVAVVDSGYRGEIKCRFKILSDYDEVIGFSDDLIEYIDDKFSGNSKIFNIGDRVAQLVILPYPRIEVEEASELSETERGSGGFGSTGK